MTSLKRTPPTSLKQPIRDLDIGASLSDSDEKTRERLMRSRTKRTRGDKDDSTDVSACMHEVKGMFEALSEKQTQKFDKFEKILEKVDGNYEHLKKSLDFMCSQYEDLKTKYDIILKERDTERAYVQTLENTLEKLQHNEKLSCVELRNVPEPKKPESKQQLLDLVMKVGTTFELDLKPCDFKDVYRANSKPGTGKPIVANFTSVIVKEKFIDASRLYNRKHKGDRLNTATLRLDCPKTAVYVSEALTPKMKKLHFLARDFARTYRYAFCWISHGKVYIREKENSPAIRINSVKDLDSLPTRKAIN